MGEAVAERTYLRRVMTDAQKSVLDPDVVLHPADPHLRQWLVALHNTGGYRVTFSTDAAKRGGQPETEWETWGDVADRVAYGNASLLRIKGVNDNEEAEREELAGLIAKGAVLMSGRHLQQGDEHQLNRPQEVLNCLAGENKIATLEYGSIEIRELAGMSVTLIAADGLLRTAVVHEHPAQQLCRIVFRAVSGGSGRFRNVVRATANHTWFLRGGNKTQNLSHGDVVEASDHSPVEDHAAIIHGLIFGDGSAHKRRHDHARPGVSQGRTYASIRVCKRGEDGRVIHQLLDAAGFRFTTPAHAGGDRVYYLGKQEHFKEVPFTTDPDYISGFIRGWWLADGAKGVNHALALPIHDGGGFVLGSRPAALAA